MEIAGLACESKIQTLPVISNDVLGTGVLCRSIADQFVHPVVISNIKIVSMGKAEQQ
jgi:hypothetical protein